MAWSIILVLTAALISYAFLACNAQRQILAPTPVPVSVPKYPSTNSRHKHYWTCPSLPESMTIREYQRYRNDPSVLLSDDSSQDESKNNSTTEEQDQAQKDLHPLSSSIIHRLVIVPGYEGTILRDLKQRIPGGGNAKLFLAPLVSGTIRETYTKLQDLDSIGIAPITGMETYFDIIDYPAAVCAPFPLSHATHCMPLPAKGAMSQLIHKMEEHYGMIQNEDLFVLPYDWRQSYFEPDSFFDEQLISLFKMANGNSQIKQNDKMVFLAHESGCIKLVMALDRIQGSSSLSGQLKYDLRDLIQSLFCVSAPWQGRPDLSLSLLNGILFEPRVYSAHSWADRAYGGSSDSEFTFRVDMRSMASQFGMKRGSKTLLPDIPPMPWNPQYVLHTSLSAKVLAYVDHVAPELVMASLRKLPSTAELGIELSSLYETFPPPCIMSESSDVGTSAEDVVKQWSRFRDTVKAAGLTGHSDRRLMKSILSAGASLQRQGSSGSLKVYCVYGRGVNTPVSYILDSSTMAPLRQVSTTDGDGLVIDSSSVCSEIFGEHSVDHGIHFQGTSHFDMLTHPDFASRIMAELTGSKS